jgi:prolyl-tRNA synthetase
MVGELLKAVDRGGRGFVFSPTHEEAVTSLVAGIQPISHK